MFCPQAANPPLPIKKWWYSTTIKCTKCRNKLFSQGSDVTFFFSIMYIFKQTILWYVFWQQVSAGKNEMCILYKLWHCSPFQRTFTEESPRVSILHHCFVWWFNESDSTEWTHGLTNSLLWQCYFLSKTRYLDSQFVLRPNVNNLFVALQAGINVLPTSNLIQSSMDGPSTNWVVLKKLIDQRSRDELPSIEDIGSWWPLKQLNGHSIIFWRLCGSCFIIHQLEKKPIFK